jgi:hypothetical protein
MVAEVAAKVRSIQFPGRNGRNAKSRYWSNIHILSLSQGVEDLLHTGEPSPEARTCLPHDSSVLNHEIYYRVQAGCRWSAVEPLNEDSSFSMIAPLITPPHLLITYTELHIHSYGDSDARCHLQHPVLGESSGPRGTSLQCRDHWSRQYQLW